MVGDRTYGLGTAPVAADGGTICRMNDEPPPESEEEIVETLRVSIGGSGREPSADSDEEIVDGQLLPDDELPVLAELRSLEAPVDRHLPSPLQRPAVQAAAAAATGFLAGAATLALLRRGDARRLARQARDLADLRDRLAGPGRSGPGMPLAPGRTYLVQFRVLSALAPAAPPVVSPRPPAATPRLPE